MHKQWITAPLVAGALLSSTLVTSCSSAGDSCMLPLSVSSESVVRGQRLTVSSTGAECYSGTLRRLNPDLSLGLSYPNSTSRVIVRPPDGGTFRVSLTVPRDAPLGPVDLVLGGLPCGDNNSCAGIIRHLVIRG